jgi:putative ABC transport system substrate-binding protein
MIRRRAFITLLGGAAAWPFAARAQQPPVIGFLSGASPGPDFTRLMDIFRRSIAEFGYVEGQNFAVDYRFAHFRYDRLPDLAADLARRQVALIVTGSSLPAALVAKAATATIPIVFSVVQDAVSLGLVNSLSRPGGNATGVNYFIAELASKQLGLLREIAPAADRVGLLVNPANPTADSTLRNATAAADRIGLQLDVIHARDGQEIEAAFIALDRSKVAALLVGTDLLFYSRRIHLATFAARYRILTIFPQREYAEAGGLMSYGTDWTEVYQHVGRHAGRILKGAKPADLPVVQSTKFELVINLPTSRALGIDVPATLLARADEVIE